MKKSSNNSVVKKIIKNASIILTGNIAASGLGLISFTLMARSLGPEFLSYFVLSQVYVGVLNSVFNVQTWESMIKFGTKDENKNNIKDIVKTNVTLDILGASIAFIFAITLLDQIAKQLDWDDTLVEVAFLYSFTIPFLLTTLTIGIPRLYNKFAIIAKIQFMLAIFKLSLISLFSFKGGTPKDFVMVYIASDILINLFIIFYSTRLIRKKNGAKWWRKAKLKITREQIKFIWWTNLKTIVRIPVRQLDVVIISIVMTMEVVGIYKVYKEIVAVIGRLGDPINQAIYPEYAKLLGKRKSTETVSVTRHIMLFLLIISLCIMLVLIAGSEYIVATFFGEQYLSMINALYILIVLGSINLFLTPINSLFLASGFAKYGFYLVLFTNIIYLSVAIIAGQRYGIYGIILAFFLQMILNQGLKIVLMKKYSSGWSDVIR